MHTILVFFYLSHNFTHFFRTSVYLEHEGKGHSFVSSNVDVESWTGRTRYCLKDTCVKPHWIQQALKINWKKNHTSRWSKKKQNKSSMETERVLTSRDGCLHRRRLTQLPNRCNTCTLPGRPGCSSCVLQPPLLRRVYTAAASWHSVAPPPGTGGVQPDHFSYSLSPGKNLQKIPSAWRWKLGCGEIKKKKRSAAGKKAKKPNRKWS